MQDLHAEHQWDLRAINLALFLESLARYLEFTPVNITSPASMITYFFRVPYVAYKTWRLWRTLGIKIGFFVNDHEVRWRGWHGGQQKPKARDLDIPIAIVGKGLDGNFECPE